MKLTSYPIFVYLFLVAQYESWSLPLSILLGTPFAIFGAFLALVLLEGGESRPAEDGCWYPDARQMSEGRVLVEPYREPPP